MTNDIVQYQSKAIQTRTESPLKQFLAGQLSAQTKRAYQTDIRLFFEYTGLNPDDVLNYDLNEIYSMVIQYRDSISKIQDGTKFIINASTVARKMTAIKTYFDFLVKLKLISINPASDIKSPAINPDSTSEGLTLSELKSIFSLIDNRVIIGKRDKAILSLMFHCALRRSEVAKLKIQDIRTSAEFQIIRFIGKRNKVREIPLKPEVMETIKDYLTATGRNLSSGGFMFLSHSNRNNGTDNISPETIFYLVKRYTNKAKINKRITPHSFRHTAVTLSLDNGSSYRDVMNLTGHSDPKLVKRYDRGDKLKNNATWKLPSIN